LVKISGVVVLRADVTHCTGESIIGRSSGQKTILRLPVDDFPGASASVALKDGSVSGQEAAV
jgi:hypothetical protein